MPRLRYFPLTLPAASGLFCAGLLCCAVFAQTVPVPAEKPAPAVGPKPQVQERSSPAGRQKIGLVLNGGGALGLAHVGVLRWLEEHHIPIDMVAGTSMGGLIGGAYATGDSPAEVLALVKSINWDQVISDQPPYQDISFRRKEDAAEFPVAVQFGVSKKGLRFQEGYKAGQQVQLTIDKVVLPYSEVRNFDDLPIPFGCVATDLVSGRPHVFRSGSLALALRSTMSLPGVFAPTRADGAVYADGGLLDNLPVDVAKQMGADITLAIYLQTAPLSPDERLSSVGVLGRGISVMIAANELRSMQAADILVSIPLQKFTSLDYNKEDALIQAGYEAAQAKAAVLEKLSVDDATWQAYLAQRNSRKRTVPVPQFVAVNGVSEDNANVIKRALTPDLNQPIVPETVARQLTTVASNERVANLSYGLATSTSGLAGIAVTGTQEPFGRNIVRPLILVDGWDLRNVTFSLGARLTMLDLGHYGSELRVDGLFGSDYLLDAEYYRPMGETRKIFVAPRALLDDTPLNYYNENGLIAEYRIRNLGGGVDLGDYFNASTELRIGYEGGYLKIYPNVVNPQSLPTTEAGRAGDTHARFVYDGLDDPITPSKGLRVLANWEWWDAHPIATSAFPVAELRTIDFMPIRRGSAYLAASGGSTLWTNPPILPPPFSLGGSFRLPAYNTNELLTNQYFLFQGGYVYQLARLSPLLGGKMDLFLGADAGKAYGYAPTSKESRIPSDGAVGLLINALVGPIVVGGSVGDRGHHKFFFEIGRVYF